MMARERVGFFQRKTGILSSSLATKMKKRGYGFWENIGSGDCRDRHMVRDFRRQLLQKPLPKAFDALVQARPKKRRGLSRMPVKRLGSRHLNARAQNAAHKPRGSRLRRFLRRAIRRPGRSAQSSFKAADCAQPPALRFIQSLALPSQAPFFCVRSTRLSRRAARACRFTAHSRPPLPAGTLLS